MAIPRKSIHAELREQRKAALQSLMAEHCSCLRKLAATTAAAGMMTEREYRQMVNALAKVEKRVVALVPENVQTDGQKEDTET